MPFVNVGELPEVERLPGWRGRHLDSPSITFGYREFDAGPSIHEHSHPQEEVWLVVEGELEITVSAKTKSAGPGGVAIVPPGVRHSVSARSDGRALAVDHPVHLVGHSSVKDCVDGIEQGFGYAQGSRSQHDGRPRRDGSKPA